MPIRRRLDFACVTHCGGRPVGSFVWRGPPTGGSWRRDARVDGPLGDAVDAAVALSPAARALGLRRSLCRRERRGRCFARRRQRRQAGCLRCARRRRLEDAGGPACGRAVLPRAEPQEGTRRGGRVERSSWCLLRGRPVVRRLRVDWRRAGAVECACSAGGGDEIKRACF